MNVSSEPVQALDKLIATRYNVENLVLGENNS